MAKAKKNERAELFEKAGATAKLWEALCGVEKEKPPYRLANALAELCVAVGETANDLDQNWKVVQRWQAGEEEDEATGAEAAGGGGKSGAKPEVDEDPPSVLVLEFRNQYLEDGGKLAAALRDAMRCAELVAMDGFEAAFAETTAVAAAAWALLAMIKRDE